MRICELSEEERPRDKFRRQGAGALSNAELLAILLRVGVKGTNAVDTARLLLQRSENSLERLCALSLENMCEIDGVGMDKAVAVSAAMELARRLVLEQGYSGKKTVDGPSAAFRILSSCYTSDSREECWCLFLKRSRRMLGQMRVSEGGETLTEINIKQIVRKALDLGAQGIILSHNHPSGNPKPSKADIRQTKQLREALSVFELSLVDHIIVSETGYYSFSAEQCFIA